MRNESMPGVSSHPEDPAACHYGTLLERELAQTAPVLERDAVRPRLRSEDAYGAQQDK